MQRNRTLGVIGVIALSSTLGPVAGAQQTESPRPDGGQPAKELSGVAGRAGPATGEVVADLDNAVGVVFQDRDGTYWFGSKGGGLYRYDGKTLVRFTTDHGLASGYIGSVRQDRSGAILVQCDPVGISRFDGRAFQMLVPVNADASKGEWKLQADDLWFAGPPNSGTVYRYDGVSLHKLAFPTTKAGDDHYAQYPRSLYPGMRYSPYDVYTIFKDSKGHVWFGTGTLGVCRYDGSTFAWASTGEVGLGPNDNFGMRSIIEDRDGKFWFTHTRHRYAISPSEPGQRGTVALSYRKEPGLPRGNDPVVAFLSSVKDKNGDLWLATLGDGVYKYDGAGVTHYPVTIEGQPQWIYSIAQDNQGVFWVGTQKHGVYRFNGKAFERFRP